MMQSLQYLMGERLSFLLTFLSEFCRWRMSSSFWRVLILILLRLVVEEATETRILSSVCSLFRRVGVWRSGIWVSFAVPIIINILRDQNALEGKHRYSSELGIFEANSTFSRAYHCFLSRLMRRTRLVWALSYFSLIKYDPMVVIPYVGDVL